MELSKLFIYNPFKIDNLFCLLTNNKQRLKFVKEGLKQLKDSTKYKIKNNDSQDQTDAPILISIINFLDNENK